MKAGLIILICMGLSLASGAQQKHISVLESFDYNFRRTVDKMENEYKAGNLTDHEYKHFMRWKIASMPYIDTDGTIARDEKRIYREFQKFLREQKREVLQERVPNGHWASITPTQFDTDRPFNGRLNCIAVHPTNSNIIYVGAPVGGVWKTTDNAASWTSMTDGVPYNSISAIEFHPDNPNHIYALTGDGDGSDMRSMGIIESFDGGLSWQETQFTWGNNNMYGYDLLIDPIHPQTMYAATSKGLYATNDNWNDWDQIWQYPVYDVEFKPGTTSTLYAAAGLRIIRYDSSDTELVQSILSDGEGPSSGLPDPDTIGSQRTALAVSPHNPERVYALFAKNTEGNGFLGLYMSDDGGETFSLKSSTPNIVGAGDRNQVTYDLELAVDPFNADEVYVGGIEVYRSYNQGATGTWELISYNNTQAIHADIHDIVFKGSVLYVATDGGISRSHNEGDSWIYMSEGLNIMQFYDIDVRHISGIDHIVAGGTQDNGTNQWQIGDLEASNILWNDGFEVIYDPSNVSTVYASTQGSRHRSYNSGATWTNITPEGDDNNWDASWIMHPTDHDTMYCAQNDIKRTYDQGDTWEPMNGGFSSNIRAMAQGVNNPNALYASDRFSLKLSTSANSPTVNWLDLTPFLPVTLSDNLLLGGICVNPENANHVWFTCMNYQGGAKVFFSSTAGLTWVNWSNSLYNVPVHCVAFNPGSPNGVYIGTDIGVWYRDSTMTAWQYFGNGLPRTQVTDLKVIDGYLYAGTYGRGIWRSPLLTPCPSENMLTQANDPSSANHTGHQRYYVANQLVSSRIVTGGVGTDVKYVAGGNIRLVPGFEVHHGNIFRAFIGGCLFE